MALKRRATMRYIITALLVVLTTCSTVWAGGAYLTEINNAEVGLASAGWAARAQDAGTVFTNPAGMTRLKQNELYGGIQPMYFSLEFDPDSNTTMSGKDGSASDWINGGSVFYVHDVSEELKLGVGILGYFGLGVDFGDDWVGRYYVTEGGLQGLTFTPAVAYKVNDWLSLGAGLVATYMMFEQKAAMNNPDAPDGSLKMEDSDLAFGANLGALVELNERTRIGLQYLSEAEFDLEDKPRFLGLGPVLEGALGAAGLLNSEIKMSMTAPQAVMLSGFHALNDQWAIMGNVGWQDWSEFGKVRVEVKSTTTTSLTLDNKYKDSWHAALGTQYQLSDPWRLSLGIAYDSSIVDDEDRTLDVPMGESWRFGTAAVYKVRENMELGLAYELMWFGNLKVDVDDGPLTGRVSGEYEDVHMHFINLAFNWRF
jgi:long-chain fatty acid transport protein